MRICISPQGCNEIIRRYTFVRAIGLCFKFHLQFQCTFKLCVETCKACEANPFAMYQNFDGYFIVAQVWLKFEICFHSFSLQVQLPFKMQAAHDAAQFAGTTSNLATVLQYLCVWGQISWSVGQQIARAAELDSEAFDLGLHPMVKSFAKLGTSGIYVGNVRRDAMRTFKVVAGLSQPLMLRLPFKTTRGVVTEQDFPIILPSVIFEDLFRNSHRKFISMLGGAFESSGIL